MRGNRLATATLLPTKGMSDSKLDQMQDRVNHTFQKVMTTSGVLASELKDVVLLATTDTPMAHRLGQIPDGWSLTRINADANVWEVAADDRVLTLRASAACKISLRVW